MRKWRVERPGAGMDDGMNAYRQLVALSRRYASGARPLPAQGEMAATCTLVCFRVMGAPVAILLDEVRELLHAPFCTRLPRVKSWVRGVANVRGSLMPIIDFAAFLGGRLQSTPKTQRVLVVESEGMVAGLVVDEVLGMKHLKVDSFSEQRKGVPPALGAYVPGVFSGDGEHWALLRPEALFSHGAFLDVTADQPGIVNPRMTHNGTQQPGE